METKPAPLLHGAPTEVEKIEFAAPTECAHVAKDHASMGLTLSRHSLTPLRPRLANMGIRTAKELRHTAMVNEQVRARGTVTQRQLPSTASGVILATLEDETGTVHIIVWPSGRRGSAAPFVARCCCASRARGRPRKASIR